MNKPAQGTRILPKQELKTAKYMMVANAPKIGILNQSSVTVSKIMLAISSVKILCARTIDKRIELANQSFLKWAKAYELLSRISNLLATTSMSKFERI